MSREAEAGAEPAPDNDLTGETIDELMRGPVAPPYRPVPLAGVQAPDYPDDPKPGGK